MTGKITMAHGGGGELSARLIADVFLKAFGGSELQANDSAVIQLQGGRTAITTDSFVISPIFFPGGDIGKLAFCGTVNDLAAVGAVPQALTASFIIEEGMAVNELKAIVESMGEISRMSGIPIIAGDTKVVEKGSGDKVYINTTGIGLVPQNLVYHPAKIVHGDLIIVSGTIGDHGYCITALREGIDIRSSVLSDCQPLHEMVSALAVLDNGIHAARDATRGGLGTVLNEWVRQSGKGILIKEFRLPVLPEVRGGCGLLGLEPLYLANEGKMVFAVTPERAGEALALLRNHPAGRDAEIIGEVSDDKAQLIMETEWGTRRLVPVPRGELLPRIC